MKNEVEIFLNEKYDFRYNEVIGRTLYKEKNKQRNYNLLKGYKFNSIKRELKNNGIKTSVQELRSLLESDFVSKFDPFKDYFDNLPQWDNKTDYINELAKTIQTNNDELFRWAFKKWLVALVGCAIDEEVTNHTVLIITGEQGSGKTTWLTNLVPKQLKEYCYSGRIKPDNKDSTILLSEKLLINMDELASYSKGQVESFKELITKDVISERRAYGYFTENYVRRASFAGSSNHEDILLDVTGNRRFLVFAAHKIDYLNEYDLERVYSQAISLYRNKFKFFFDKEDIERIEKNNEQFKQTNIEEEYLDKFFEIPSDENSESVLAMNASEIIDYIKKHSNSYVMLNPVSFGKIIKAKGFQAKKIKSTYKYLVQLNEI
ncbi:VapE family protein [Leeuwenhoekiella aequorea]|uniref:VapE domain-containing protein n=1 Tax=Leeuwenhoekiella aequorea TaxID=283736 RepID=UPI00352CF50D